MEQNLPYLDYIIIIIIIKSTKYVQDILPLFVGCNMQVRLIENLSS